MRKGLEALTFHSIYRLYSGRNRADHGRFRGMERPKSAKRYFVVNKTAEMAYRTASRRMANMAVRVTRQC